MIVAFVIAGCIREKHACGRRRARLDYIFEVPSGLYLCDHQDDKPLASTSCPGFICPCCALFLLRLSPSGQQFNQRDLRMLLRPSVLLWLWLSSHYKPSVCTSRACLLSLGFFFWSSSASKASYISSFFCTSEASRVRPVHLLLTRTLCGDDIASSVLSLSHATHERVYTEVRTFRFLSKQREQPPDPLPDRLKPRGRLF